MPTLVANPNPLILIPFGVFVGLFAGIFGLGGGAVIVPLLVLLFGMNQQEANGTSLAIILAPTSIPAIWKYHDQGFVHLKFALLIAPGMLVGSYFGARIATAMNPTTLRLLFGFVLIYVASYMVFSTIGGKEGSLTRAMTLALLTVATAAGLFGVATVWARKGA